MVSQLRALLTQRRVVFIGFGFQDQEVLRVLKLVGRLCSPARPAFAFLHGIWGKEHREERRELLELYNVDVIPYLVEGNSHRQLHDLLETYGSFVLRRSQRFGRTTHTCPSYDPETTGLLIYNQALGGGLRLAQDVLGSIIQARILSLLQFRGSQSIDAIYSDIRERAAAISPGEQVDSGSTRQVDEQIRELERQGYIGVDERSQARTIELTTQGAELAKNQAARAERLSEQFSASVSSRVGQRGISSAVALARVAGVVESFLKECVQRRSLGVAIMWGSSLSDTRSYQMVALMQALPEFLEGLENSDEAKVVIRVVTDVFARPTEAERTYLGLLLQAQFGLHLLGYDPSTLRARSHELARTLFLIDSPRLFP